MGRRADPFLRLFSHALIAAVLASVCVIAIAIPGRLVFQWHAFEPGVFEHVTAPLIWPVLAFWLFVGLVAIRLR
jgi:hypothetical protein